MNNHRGLVAADRAHLLLVVGKQVGVAVGVGRIAALPEDLPAVAVELLHAFEVVAEVGPGDLVVGQAGRNNDGGGVDARLAAGARDVGAVRFAGSVPEAEGAVLLLVLAVELTP